MNEQELLSFIIEKEKMYQFESFFNKDALEIGLLIIEESKKYENPVAVEIEVNNFLIFRYIPEGCNRIHDGWLKAKRNTVTTFEKSSYQLGLEIKIKDIPQESVPMIPGEFAYYGGGFPIRLKNGCLIGVIATSGLSPTKDNNIILEALEQYFEKYSK